MRALVNRLICRIKGHRRGKRVECRENGSIKVFACPRCGRRREYKK